MNNKDVRNQEATVYVGNLDEKVSDGIVWELFVQAGPVVNVYLPRDRVSQVHQGYGFVEFVSEEDADYAIKIMNMVKLYGKPLRVNKAAQDKAQVMDIGANLFIGSLDPQVDEKTLYDTFSAFGSLIQTPKVGRDPDTGESKGYGFVSFTSFEASDAAIEAMNGQFIFNKAVTVSYALKKDGKGERHGSAAERLLAAQSNQLGINDTNAFAANARFAPPPIPPMGGANANLVPLGYPPGQVYFQPPPPVYPPMYSR